MAGYNSEKTPNVRVTVLEDPNNSLQELFNPISQRQQVPWNQRNLPKSFFVPPTGLNDPSHLSGVGSTDIVISHSKANSSPASLDAPVCAAVNSDVPSHVHQKSLDIAADYTHGYCPEVSFCDFRKQGFIQSDSEAQTPPFSCRPRLKFAVRELPAWFEMTQNEKNQVYFLNHETQETTWFDPRIPVGHQKWGMTLDELQQVHINYARYLGQNPPNVGQYRPSISSASATVSSGCITIASATTGVHGPSVIAHVSSPAPVLSPTNSTVLSPTIAVLCTAPGSSSTPSSNVPVGGSGARVRVSGSSTAPNSHRTHPPKAPHTHSLHGQSDQSAHVDVQHHRQHSHGHPTQAHTPANHLGTHNRSCSQPVPMSVGHDGSAATGHLQQATSASSRSGTQPQLSGPILGLSASSSLIGLSVASASCGPLVGQVPHLGSATTNSSSGQLVQGLECLRLNTSTSPASALATSPHMLEAQSSQRQQRVQQQQQQAQTQQQPTQHAQTPYMLPVNALSPSLQGGSVRFASNVVTPTPLSAAQHSHQGSMDSGVGQSLTGQSSASADQTPEHAVMLFCDPRLNECNTEHMEGISYPSEEIGCTPYNVFDNIDISDITA
ncbi:DNA-binding transcription factor yap1 [Clonorchis sinensis]|uniref:DNA-binding transcription factor yap1 n=1 Tax=Clonorchis sinensis TaxID=79923 RepID=A0A8T1MRS8_CLOSI|nr:DNA-binding transcription factor yap1 [Clonorchis sinensis]